MAVINEEYRLNHRYTPREVRALRLDLACEMLALVLGDRTAPRLPVGLRQRLGRVLEELRAVGEALRPDEGAQGEE